MGVKDSERKELLEEVKELSEKDQELNFKFLITVLLSMFITFMLTFPKIYIRNHIYYTSRDVNKLLDEYETLKEENAILKQKLEYIRYKNQVLDTMF